MKNMKANYYGNDVMSPSRSSRFNMGSGNIRNLTDLLVDGLRDIYWAEKALTRAMPKMIKNATSSELANALDSHLEETRSQVTRLEEVFRAIDQKVSAKKCVAMEGLINEAEHLMEEAGEGSVRDAAIIAAAQKIEHYEIATYGTLVMFAKTLGEEAAASLLEEILDEEKEADVALIELAEDFVVNDAGDPDDEELDEDYDEDDEDDDDELDEDEDDEDEDN